ncbi:hypothetical protein HWV07_07100 [Natronomonas salina]|uniref:hypothetical protein n=1 Tax=Natronomonas salina TaxID=1710540 RepID=UPI0015B78ADD|nr:hypothetical protein [Natronomonas salina]QLD88812.1 hypothetical protein HWV07_07100 [Natronomonas salina]
MSMNRRNVLIGLGATAAGGGAVLGSGAFSQVEADRTMEVQFSDDSSAELTLSPTSQYASTESNNDSPNGANTLFIQLSNLNDNALSTFDGVFEITNNDSTGAEHDIQVLSNGDVDGTVIDFQDSSGTSLVGSSQTLAHGGTISVSIEIDTSGGTTIDQTQTVTFRAN